MTKEEIKNIIGDKVGEVIYNKLCEFYKEVTGGDFEKELESVQIEEFEETIDGIVGQLNKTMTVAQVIDIADQVTPLPEKDPNIN